VGGPCKSQLPFHSPMRSPPCREMHGAGPITSVKVNRNIVPGFYRFLQAQENQAQIQYSEELKNEVCNPLSPSGSSLSWWPGSPPLFSLTLTETEILICGALDIY